MMTQDWNLKLRCTGVFGRSGFGKSTLVDRYICNSPDVSLVSAFDFKPEMFKRFGVPLVGTGQQMEAALRTRYVMFNPHVMFSGRLKEAFEFWCRWFYAAAQRGPGRKIALIDEPWKFCSPSMLPEFLADMVQAGRGFGVETMFSSQRPNRMNEGILQELTEVVCFRLNGKNALKALEENCEVTPEALAKIQKLEEGQFYAVDTIKGREREGRLW